MRDIRNPQKVKNVSRRNFWWQLNFDFRKVPIEKVRFAPRIDIITQKLAAVASGEVSEYLHFYSHISFEK